MCNKCKRWYLSDCNNSLRCYNYGKAGHIAWDYQNCGKPSHLIKDCLNCYSCEKSKYFARDCPEQDKSTSKQGNARVYALTQGEVDVPGSGRSNFHSLMDWHIMIIIAPPLLIYSQTCHNFSTIPTQLSIVYWESTIHQLSRLALRLFLLFHNQAITYQKMPRQ